MKRRSSLTLIELAIMLLVFALAAALCLQVFAASDRISQQSEDRDRAVLLAQDAAEVLKHTGGDYGQAALLLGGVWQNGVLSVHPGGGLSLFVTPTENQQPCLGSALVEVCSDGDAVRLCSLPVCWQEVTEYE